jgi:uncharacterized protein (DUF3820 family)
MPSFGREAFPGLGRLSDADPDASPQVGDLNGQAIKVNRDTLMPFGKFRGLPISDLDPRYLFWLISLKAPEERYPELYRALRDEAFRVLGSWEEEEKEEPLSPS